LLAACYADSLALARAHALRSIAFPAISTGVYLYPPERAARVAAEAVSGELEAHPGAFDAILFVCFSAAAARLYSGAIEAARRP
jgi:O-acetyl-ADP-ribose deacetylase (regulator of RNase III)